MPTPQIIAGDDITLSVTLKKNGSTFVIGNSASVKVKLVSTNHQTALSDDVPQSYSTQGANWGASLVEVRIGATMTSGLGYQGLALLEIQVDDGGKTKWFVPVQIVKGLIA